MTSVVKSLGGVTMCMLQDLRPEDTVAEVKARVEAETGLSSLKLKLGINGKFTRDRDPISVYGWRLGDPLVACVSLREAIRVQEKAAKMTDAARKAVQEAFRIQEEAAQIPDVAKLPEVLSNTPMYQVGTVLEVPAATAKKSVVRPSVFRMSGSGKSPHKAQADMPKKTDVDEASNFSNMALKSLHEHIDDACIEYGYLQIFNYAHKHRRKSKGVALGPKFWVPIPTGTKVYTYPRNQSALETDPRTAHQLRSCLKRIKVDRNEACSSPRSVLSETSDSTVASASDNRRVRFCDMRVSGSRTLSDGVRAPLAEWVYIDRDICGISIHEYAPRDPQFQDFASSTYGFHFLSELFELEALIERDHTKAACETSLAYQHEEQMLDDALKLAGVKQKYLRACNSE